MARHFRTCLDTGDREKAMAGFVDTWAGAGGSWDGLPEPVKDTMRHGTDRLYHEWLVNLYDAPSHADLAELDIPVLLFKGSETIPSMSRVCELVARAIPDCQYVEIDGAGHMSPFTHARIVLPVIEAHLAGSQA